MRALILSLIPIAAIATVAPPLVSQWLDGQSAQSASANVAKASAPISGVARIPDRGDGHFEISARVGARRIPFMVDTGATLVALTWETGRDLGLARPGDPMTVEVSTANGKLRAMRVTLDRLDIDGVSVDGVQALVLPQGALATNLLGMSYLSRLGHFEMTRGMLVLEQ